MTKNTALVLLSGVLLLCAAAFVYVWNKPQNNAVNIQTTLDINGRFTLINQDGRRVSTDEYKGKYKIVYFGFTHCPAICPTELQKIITSLKILGPLAGRFQPIFITIDPERDTVPVLKDYVGLFGKSLAGFTGTSDEIAAVEKQYRVYAAKAQDADATEYTMDHSSFVYVMGPDDRLIDLFKSEDTPKIMAARLKALPAP